VRVTLLIALILSFLPLAASAAVVRVYRVGGADIPADSAWRTVISQNFPVTTTTNTSGTVFVTFAFANQSCTGNSANCSPAKMAVGQVRVSLRDNTGYLHDQETMWIENSVVLNPNGGVVSLMVRNSGPYSLHLAAPDMRSGTYTLTVEVWGQGGTSFRPLRHNGIKATVSVY
jgi:hypothetical protein